MDLVLGGRKKKQHQADIAHSEDAAETLIAPGTDFEGTLKSASGIVCLNSSFRGKAVSEGTILIGDNGDVEASLSARVIKVSGKLKGSATASERLEITARGVVLGDISTPVLLVEPGGYLDGQCHMPVPESGKTSVKGEAAIAL